MEYFTASRKQPKKEKAIFKCIRYVNMEEKCKKSCEYSNLLSAHMLWL